MANGKSKATRIAVESGKLSAFVDPTGALDGWDGSDLNADWSSVRGNLIVGAVVVVNREGGSLLFGHTRDGKSYSVVVFFGDAKKNYYFTGDGTGLSALETFLMGLIEVGS